MRARHLLTLVVVLGLALPVGACGDDGGGGGAGGGGGDGGQEPIVQPQPDAAGQFEKGTKMAQLAQAGRVKIGVKKDQPGIGFQKPGEDAPQGLDIEMAKILAAKLGIGPENIEWVETVSKNREPFLQNGTVDMVLASYSITDERREVVGQAGPYYVTGQQLLVREEDKDTINGPDKLKGRKTCSVTGSTSIKTVEEEYGATPAPFATYSECVQQLLNGQVDAVTTDGAILLGYAAEQPDRLEVVGPEFSEERYGVGYQKQETEMCEFITSTLRQSFDNGNWQEAFRRTLGQAGVEPPSPPELDPCRGSGSGSGSGSG